MILVAVPANDTCVFSATYITKMTVRLADADFRETLRDTHSEDFKQLASSLKTPVSGIQTVFNPFTPTRTTPSLKPDLTK